MGDDEVALVRLWKEKRGEVAPEDLSVGEPDCPAWDGHRRSELALVRAQFGAGGSPTCSGTSNTQGLKWMAVTLDGRVEVSGAVFEAEFMLPWSFSEQVAAEK